MTIAVFDLLSTAVLLLDGDTHIQHANAAAEELFGCSRRHLIGQAAMNLLSEGSSVQPRFSDAVAGKLGTLHLPLHIKPHGEAIAVNVVIVPLRGEPWAALVELRPVEQHVLLDRHQQLGKELAAQRETLRNLAHEVKNPLGGIRAAAQLLECELDEQSLCEYTGVIIAEADRLAHLVDRLIAPQGASLRKAPLNIHEVCERARMLVGAEFASLSIQRDYDASLPELQGDFARLLQAVLNIARNAAQAMTERPGPLPAELIFRTRVVRQAALTHHQAALAVVLSIIDNGPGVPPEILDKVFHPLVTGRPEGTGLGLSIAQEFVIQHGGVLECDSHPGRTEFRMTLPLEPT